MEAPGRGKTTQALTGDATVPSGSVGTVQFLTVPPFFLNQTRQLESAGSLALYSGVPSTRR